MNIKLPNKGKIKIKGEWIEFDENDLIEIDCSNNEVKINWKECIESTLTLESKNEIFKVTSKDVIPTYDSMMRYGVSLGSSITKTPSGAFYDYTHEHLINEGYVLNIETLELFEVFREASDNNPNQTAKDLKFTEQFLRKLEKPEYDTRRI